MQWVKYFPVLGFTSWRPRVRIPGINWNSDWRGWESHNIHQHVVDGFAHPSRTSKEKHLSAGLSPGCRSNLRKCNRNVFQIAERSRQNIEEVSWHNQNQDTFSVLYQDYPPLHIRDSVSYNAVLHVLDGVSGDDLVIRPLPVFPLEPVAGGVGHEFVTRVHNLIQSDFSHWTEAIN